MRTAIDTNVISAIWTNEASAPRLVSILAGATASGAPTIAGPVYAELLAYPGATADFVDAFLDSTRATVDFRIDKEIWREAGLRFAKYASRRRSLRVGAPRRLLADCVIGAHALLRADRLLTLDVSRYKLDFPELRIITCDS